MVVWNDLTAVHLVSFFDIPLCCGHCSTGVGRTGAFIAVDAMLERLSVVKTVDIFNYVTSLRRCRQNMIRTLVSTGSGYFSVGTSHGYLAVGTSQWVPGCGYFYYSGYLALGT